MAGRHIPPGHGHRTSGSADSNELCQCALRPREVADAKVTDDDVERSIGDRKVFSVSLTKIHARESSRSKFQHSRCEVYADNRESSAAGSPEGDDAGTCGHIQNAHARPEGGRIQQGIYRVCGYRCKEVAITAGDFVVRVALEVPESVGIDFVMAHRHLARWPRADRSPSTPPNSCSSILVYAERPRSAAGGRALASLRSSFKGLGTSEARKALPTLRALTQGSPAGSRQKKYGDEARTSDCARARGRS